MHLLVPEILGKSQTSKNKSGCLARAISSEKFQIRLEFT